MATASSIHGYGLLSARPAASTATAGNYYTAYDTGYTYRDNGLTWDTVATTNPMTTAQDLIRGGASGAPTRLAVGSNGNVLTVVAGVLTWQAPATSGTVTTVSGTAPISVANGSTTPAITHDTSGVSAGTSSGITVDTKGHVTARTALVAGDLPAATTTAVGALKSPFLFAATVTQTVANTAAATSLIGTGVGTLTLPAGCLVAGRSVRVKLSGTYVSSGATGTAILSLKLGGSTVAAAYIAGLQADASDSAWVAEGMLTCYSTGVSGRVMGQAHFQYYDEDNATGLWAGSKQLTTTTVDTTGTLAFDATFTWGGADPGDSITSTNVTVELVGI